MYADYLFLLLVFIPQSVEGENHEKAVDLLKAAEGLFFWRVFMSSIINMHFYVSRLSILSGWKSKRRTCFNK